MKTSSTPVNTAAAMVAALLREEERLLERYRDHEDTANRWIAEGVHIDYYTKRAAEYAAEAQMRAKRVEDFKQVTTLLKREGFLG